MSFPDQNTVQLFEEARQAGADIVETDLRASRDGEVFLFHDKRMENLTNCVGPIGAKTASEIRRCRLKGTVLGLSTFRDALAWSAGRVVINAEFKNADAIEPAIRLVREYNAYDWVYFQTDHYYELARAADPRVALLVAPAGPKAQQLFQHYLRAGDDNLVVIELHPGIRTPKNIRAIHAAGKLASEDSWQFGKERSLWHRRARCDEVFRLGIDIAITDVPDDCVAERARFRRAPGRPVSDGPSGPGQGAGDFSTQADPKVTRFQPALLLTRSENPMLQVEGEMADEEYGPISTPTGVRKAITPGTTR